MRQLLTIPKVTLATVLREYDAEDDDIRSVLVDLTDHWESQGARMVVHVPGRDLCTATDFAILLEQAPRALATLSRGQVFTIAYFAHRDRPFRRIAIAEIGSSRSERSDVFLGLWMMGSRLASRVGGSRC